MELTKSARKKSPWILHYDCSGCNGCDIETLACLTPMYDVERFGIINVGNPKHADVLVVTGLANKKSAQVLKNLYDQMPEPKIVVAVGACSCTGGIFSECYNTMGGVKELVPVDVFVPGCAPRPEAIMDGIIKGIDNLNTREKSKKAPEKKATSQEEK